MVCFCNMKQAKAADLIPKSAKRWDACFIPNHLIWVNSRWMNSYGLVQILGHELRHFYQVKTKRYPMTVKHPMPDDHRKMSKQRLKKYSSEPHEKDAFAFAEWLQEQYDREREAGKIEFQIISDKYTII